MGNSIFTVFERKALAPLLKKIIHENTLYFSHSMQILF